MVPYKLFGHLCSVVSVASFDAPSLAMACVLEEVDLLFSPVPSSLGSRQVTMAYELGENGTSLARSLSDFRQSP
jgi:hypothetical protein